MNLLIIKKWGMKSLLWVKHNWYIPLSLIAIAVSYVLFKEKADSLVQALMDNRDGYKEQVQKVNEIHDKQISERNKNLAAKDKKVKELNAEHEERMNMIEDKKDALVEELKEKDLASELDKEFNL